MKQFKVTVNGQNYEVEVEELGGGISPAPVGKPAPAAAAPSPAPAAARTKPAPVPAAKPAAPDEGEGTTLNAPMPGTILSVDVKEGDTVSRGQVLLILEAMKMENEIMAAADGRVVSIKVAKGESVASGDPMLVLKFD